MPHERFKTKVAAIEKVRRDDGPAAVALIRKALADRSGFVVAKAATAASDAGFDEVLPQLEAALRRLIAAAGDDPGCRAKDALAKALRDLGCRDPAPFAAGLAHSQLEPVWGGTADTAGPLRATCARALVACDIDAAALLELLVDHLVDTDKWVRIAVAETLAHLDRPESVVLLRLKALAGDAGAEVTGACLRALMAMAGGRSAPFVARFLDAGDEDVRFETLDALAQSKADAGFAQIEGYSRRELPTSVRRNIVRSLAACPHEAATNFLLVLAREGEDDLAYDAVRALAASRFASHVRERLTAVAGERRDERFARVLAEEFGVSEGRALGAGETRRDALGL